MKRGHLRGQASPDFHGPSSSIVSDRWKDRRRRAASQEVTGALSRGQLRGVFFLFPLSARATGSRWLDFAPIVSEKPRVIERSESSSPAERAHEVSRGTFSALDQFASLPVIRTNLLIKKTSPFNGATHVNERYPVVELEISKEVETQSDPRRWPVANTRAPIVLRSFFLFFVHWYI